jgi:ribonuclease P protein component
MIPRIKKRADFLKVSHQGIKARMRHFTVLCGYQNATTPFHTIRIGFTASKRVGNAVHRNRAKRRMRTLVDPVLIQTIHKDTSLDFVIIAHYSIIDADRTSLEADFKKAVTICMRQIKSAPQSA